MDPVDLRILQANERTLLAWVRTGLGLMAFGFVVARLSVWMEGQEEHARFPMSLYFGVALVVVGAACEIIGARRFVTARTALLAGNPIVPGDRSPVAIATIVAAFGSGLVLYLLIAR